MSRSRTVIIINTNNDLGTQQDQLDASANNQRVFGHKVLNYFRGLIGGARIASVKFGTVLVSASTVDAVAASIAGTATGAFTANDTVTVNGTVFTAVSQVSTPSNNQFRIGTSAATVAANLAAAINASTTDAVVGVVQASVSGAVVTITCLVPGVIGNSITVAESCSAFSFAGGATALASGSGKLPILKSANFGK